MISRIRPGLLVTALAACLLGGMMLASPAAVAQYGGNNSRDQSKYTLEPGTYERVKDVKRLIAKEKYAKAISVAKKVLPTARNDSDYAVALVDKIIAMSYLLMGKFQPAVPYLKNAVELDALQPRLQRTLIAQLATIYLSQGEYEKAIGLYKNVIAQAKADSGEVVPKYYYFMGKAYFGAKQYASAYKYIHKAIQERENATARTNEKGEKIEPKPVPKSWYKALFVSVYQQSKFDKANEIAGMLVAKFPDDKNFWKFYANTFLLLNEDKQAASVYALMNKRGMLTKKEEYQRLVSLYAMQGAPYKAASLMREMMKKGVIPRTAEKYALLSSLWMQAKEWDEALAALGKQAAIASSGKIYLRQATIYMTRLQYGKAMNAARKALRTGGLDDPGAAWMILGQAAFRANRPQAALDAFHNAADYASKRQSAQHWIKFVHNTSD